MELPFLLLLRGLSDPRIVELCEMPQSFSIKLHSKTQVTDRLGMPGFESLDVPRTSYQASEGKRSQ